ncbi:MAG: hypothetical protein RLZZ505_1064 [Verrucomicrobiota bacterium]|jgi:hypothetical protein
MSLALREGEFGSLMLVRLYRDGKQTTYDMTKEENQAMLLKKEDTIEVPQLPGCADH